jgi:thiamine biosynthesis lipoprotein
VLFVVACASKTARPSTPTRPAAEPIGAPARLLRGDDVPFVERRAVLMGTEVYVVIPTKEREAAETAIDAAIAEIGRIEDLMTDWRETSQLSAINRAAGKAPVKVDLELLELLRGSKEVSELTGGAFDVTYAAAGRYWDFQAQPPRLPNPADLERAVPKIDYRRLQLDFERMTAFLPEEGMRIGLGGIAKGYAVDQAANVLLGRGFKDFALKAGGDMRVMGRWNGKLWDIAIRDPRNKEGVVAVLPVSNVAISTSGDYEHFFEIDGKRYAHIIDPKTGWPIQHTKSVTIIGKDCWLTDGLTKGVFVKGAEAGLSLIESIPGLSAVVVDAAGAVHLSKNLVAKAPN